MDLNAALQRNMSADEEAKVVELAMQRVKGQVLLVEGDCFKIWLRGGQLYRHRPGAIRGWTCRKLNARQLVKIAPSRRILEILQATVQEGS